MHSYEVAPGLYSAKLFKDPYKLQWRANKPNPQILTKLTDTTNNRIKMMNNLHIFPMEWPLIVYGKQAFFLPLFLSHPHTYVQIDTHTAVDFFHICK